MNVIALGTQVCSGAVVEYLLFNLKVEGSRPPCAQILFRYTAGKFRWRRKLNRKFRPTCQKLFLLYILVYDIRSGYRKLTSSLVTVCQLAFF
jgi:hypothetical protein